MQKAHFQKENWAMSAKDICVLSPENIFQAGADSPKKFFAYSDFDGTFYAGDGERRLAVDRSL